MQARGDVAGQNIEFTLRYTVGELPAMLPEIRALRPV
jgi:hypothetical protein